MTRARNILFITSDEMRGDAPGFMGNPDCRTPHLDALAASGSVLPRHFAPFPKCVPSRCAMHTGRYTHTDGLRTVMGENHLPQGTPTLAGLLRTAGDETAVLGLNHVWDNDWFYGAGADKNQKGAGVVDYTSFTQGPLADLATQTRTYPSGTPRSGAHFRHLEEVDYHGLVTGEISAFGDENRTDQAVHYLTQLRDPARPFFLQVNLSKPHPPYSIHEPWYSLYDPDQLHDFAYDLPENAPLALRAQRQYRLGDDVPAAALREIRAVYYGMVSFIDDCVGRILQALDESGLREDTLIVFTADHGDYAGQYGINEKWDASLQDALLHVPCIISGPEVPVGQRVESLSEHVDWPATLCDYLDLQPQEDWVWHGSSLLPVIAGTERRQAVFADGGHEEAMRRRGLPRDVWQEKNGRRIKSTGGKQLTYRECPESMARCKMVRTDEWKLIIRETGDNELYHLATDPQEMHNIHGAPEHAQVVAELQLQLLYWCLRTDTDRPWLSTFGA